MTHFLHRARDGDRGMARRVLVLATAALLGLSTACTEPPPPQLLPGRTQESTVVVDEDVPYREVEGDQLVADVCRPKDQSGPLPLVLLLHGGGFSQGDKSNVRKLCERLADRGYAALAIQYRLLPDVFPAQVLDASAALGWAATPDVSQRYGFDTSRTAVIGSSAGAIIADSLAVGMGDPPVVPRAVVALSGATDFTGTLASPDGASAASAKIATEYMGCKDLSRCSAAREASPVFRVTAQSSPLLQVIGSDELVPLDQAQVMDQALAQAGAQHQLVVVPGAKHGLELLDSDTTSALDAFLADHL
ncbi:alpha/beta hydrolase [Streptomyces sp. NP160]|uniref:alpha/beta hydrolase n=1 Tax=Streptomyces sp. NP160 TaxID=2586637 RepID=UPI00111A6EF3|nr:alpha/beta hydrolase [Streptomyces sp. NP160]TNM61078.1 alpha/beta hydrolase [Streptomyces sp. NP160]